MRISRDVLHRPAMRRGAMVSVFGRGPLAAAGLAIALFVAPTNSQALSKAAIEAYQKICLAAQAGGTVDEAGLADAAAGYGFSSARGWIAGDELLPLQGVALQLGFAPVPERRIRTWSGAQSDVSEADHVFPARINVISIKGPDGEGAPHVQTVCQMIFTEHGLTARGHPEVVKDLASLVPEDAELLEKPAATPGQKIAGWRWSVGGETPTEAEIEIFSRYDPAGAVVALLSASRRSEAP